MMNHEILEPNIFRQSHLKLGLDEEKVWWVGIWNVIQIGIHCRRRWWWLGEFQWTFSPL